MENKIFMKYIIITLAFLCATQCLAQTQKEQTNNSQKKNLLFIMTDQQQYKALSIAGNTVLETPNLDRLAKEGSYFKNAYTPSAVCTPARSSILTGHTVENTGMRNNAKAYFFKEEGLMTMPTFDEILTDEGYHCEYYGKWHTQTSHSEIYKNPKRNAKNGESIFEHRGQYYVFRDYLNEQFPKRDLKAGEHYDTFTKRPYKTDPFIKKLAKYGKKKERKEGILVQSLILNKI